MAIAATGTRGITGWRLIAVLAALAFTFQSYVAQTHIHDAAPLSSTLAKGLHHNKSPLGNTPVECPFCQAITHAGAFFMPVAPLLFLCEQWMEMAAPKLIAGAGAGAATHNWQSRAPPRS
jgi:hypothetical protein